MFKNVVMLQPAQYEILGMVRIAVFGPYLWMTEDLDGPGMRGAMFRCYEDGNDRELAYLLVADVSADETEPDVSTLERADIENVDRYLEDGFRQGLANAGRRLIEWIPAVFHGTDDNKRLLTAYVGDDQGQERHYVDCRLSIRGRKWVISGCFDVARKDDLAGPIYATLQNVEICAGGGTT